MNYQQEEALIVGIVFATICWFVILPVMLVFAIVYGMFLGPKLMLKEFFIPKVKELWEERP